MKKFLKKHFVLLLFFLFLLIPLIDLLNPGLPVTHDGQDHVARIANFYKSLSEGNIIPRWAGNLNWGYGHPVMMFLYPFPSYASSLFHLIGFSYIDSLKLVFAITFVLSGLTMYLWIKEFLGKYPAIAAGVLYVFAPYRFVDLYVRGAIGEHVAFIFPPLVLYFLLKLSKKFSYLNFLGGCLSLSGLILSHNAISLMFLPFIIFYALFLLYKNKNKTKLLLGFLGLLLLGFGLSGFFLLPAFFEGKYTLRDIVTRGEYASRFVNFKDLIYGSWSYGGTGQFTTQLGFVQLIFIVLSPYFLFQFFKKNKSFFVLSLAILAYCFLSVLLMLNFSKPVWEIVTILQKFQFPWRLLSIVVFTTSLLGGLFVYQLNKKWQTIIVLLITILIVLSTYNYWHANAYKIYPNLYFDKIYNGTTDTGESSPIWSIRFMEKEPKTHLVIIEGGGRVKEEKRSTTEHDYTVFADGNIKLRENTLYFPGWKVYSSGKELPVEFQDRLNRGLITFKLPQGKNTVIIKFENTKLRTFSNLLTIFSFVFLVGLGVFVKKRNEIV